MGNPFKREKKQQKNRKLQKVTKKWPDTPLQKYRLYEWKIDWPVWDSVLDLIFCTPFQHFLQKVVFLRETSSLFHVAKWRRLTKKHYFLQKVLEWCAKNEVQNAVPNRSIEFSFANSIFWRGVSGHCLITFCNFVFFCCFFCPLESISQLVFSKNGAHFSRDCDWNLWSWAAVTHVRHVTHVTHVTKVGT